MLFYPLVALHLLSVIAKWLATERLSEVEAIISTKTRLYGIVEFNVPLDTV